MSASREIDCPAEDHIGYTGGRGSIILGIRSTTLDSSELSINAPGHGANSDNGWRLSTDNVCRKFAITCNQCISLE